MKCKTCQTPVPPVFAQALLDNSCPACGKEILGPQGFKAMMQMRKQLAVLDLESRITTTIAAALSEKFDLVPKSSRPDGYGEFVGLKETSDEDASEAPIEAEPVEVEEISDEELERQIRERALKDAKRQRNQKIVSEWGMDKGANFVKKGRKQPSTEEEFDEGYDDEEEEIDLESPPVFVSSSGAKAAERAARLAAAEERRNSGAFMVRRRE